MMRKRKRGFIACFALVMLSCLATGFVGCAKDRRGGADSGDGRLESVAEDSVRIKESENSFSLSWNTVPDARQYKLEITGNEPVISEYLAINLRSVKGFTFPADGKISISITAQAEGYTDSAPTVINYETEGVQLRSPEITSFENGMLEWSGSSYVTSYEVKVDNVAVTADSIASHKYDLSALSGNKRIDIIAHGDETWLLSSGATAFTYNAADKTLRFLPVTDCTVKGETLVWGAVGGAEKYKVIDIHQNVTVVEDPRYDLFDKLFVYGVYPIAAAESVVESAEVALADNIKYLEGAGTAQDPYKIKTAFDLRAIDYYETVYAEKLATNKNLPRNCYRLENDIDYSTVAAGDDETNIHTLSAPFYGTLDGNGKTIKSMRVNYDGGYWALFDYLVGGSAVKDLTFDSPEITNGLQDVDHPINATIATVAYNNYGTISGVTVSNAVYASAGGEICGIAAHNYGTVTGCTVGGTFKIEDTGMLSQACYEAAGVALENLSGGKVVNNTVTALTVEGSTSRWENDGGSGSYNNLRMVGGIVAYARKGGTVTGNKYQTIVVKKFNTDKTFEVGGIIASNGGAQSGNTAGSIIVDGVAVTATTGTATNARGKIVGKTA